MARIMRGKPTYEELLSRVRELEAEVDRLRKTDDELKTRETRHREAAELAHLGHWELDLVTNTLYWSDEIYRMFDLEPQEFGATYEFFLERVHPDDRSFVNESYTSSVTQGTGYDIVHRLLLRDGTVRYVREKCKTDYDASGKPLRSLGTVQDITEQMHTRQGFAGIIGREPAMEEMFETIRELAMVNVPVLIQGESGTGKELVANAIHDQGPRAKKPFVPVNCGALPDTLLESELFGHVRGAFTGAMRDKKGRFELADGGTLFLDEVVDLPRPVQVKLLRVLQEGRFERLGGERSIDVDVRIISASNRDLEQEVVMGAFREDLFYRLNVIPVHVPPLRKRRNDIPLLVDHFLEAAAREGMRSEGISRDAMATLFDHPWPGNVRELGSAIQYALIHAKGGRIETVHLPAHVIREPAGKRPEAAFPIGSSRPKRQGLDEDSVRRALKRAGGNKVKAARLLGCGRATLYRYLKKHPI